MNYMLIANCCCYVSFRQATACTAGKLVDFYSMNIIEYF